jgi:hypothetical protein
MEMGMETAIEIGDGDGSKGSCSVSGGARWLTPSEPEKRVWNTVRAGSKKVFQVGLDAETKPGLMVGVTAYVGVATMLIIPLAVMVALAFVAMHFILKNG